MAMIESQVCANNFIEREEEIGTRWYMGMGPYLAHQNEGSCGPFSQVFGPARPPLFGTTNVDGSRNGVDPPNLTAGPQKWHFLSKVVNWIYFKSLKHYGFLSPSTLYGILRCCSPLLKGGLMQVVGS